MAELCQLQNSTNPDCKFLFTDDNKKWLGHQGSNLGMLESKSSALPLGDAPLNEIDFLTKLNYIVKQKPTLPQKSYQGRSC